MKDEERGIGSRTGTKPNERKGTPHLKASTNFPDGWNSQNMFDGYDSFTN